MTLYTKKEAIRIVTSAAKDYHSILEGNNFLFIFRDKENNSIGFFETVFLPRNYQHLTGIEMLDENGKIEKKPLLFYKRCSRSG